MIEFWGTSTLYEYFHFLLYFILELHYDSDTNFVLFIPLIWQLKYLFQISIKYIFYIHTSSDAHPWTYHHCCIKESMGVLGLTTDALVQAARSRVDQASACVQVAFYWPPLVISFQPKPSRRFLCHLHVVDGSSPAWSCNARSCTGHAETMAFKLQTVHLKWHWPLGPPPALDTLLSTSLYLSSILSSQGTFSTSKMSLVVSETKMISLQGLGDTFPLPIQVNWHHPVLCCG